MNESFRVLELIHERALQVSARFRQSEIELQSILKEVDRHRVYQYMKYRSLMEYAIVALKLSPDVAYNHTSVLRKSQEVPELGTAIQKGELTISKARHMVKVLTPENKTELLPLAMQLSQPKLLQEIARIAPQAVAPEKARVVSEDRVALQLSVSQELMKKIRRAQDLTIQSQGKFVNLEETLEALVDSFLEKKDPMQRAKRAEDRANRKEIKQSVRIVQESVPPAIPQENVHEPQGTLPKKSIRIIRRALPSAVVRHAIMLRDRGQCTELTPQGTRCEQTRFLHFHHIRPLSLGGENTVNNLRLVCSGHHRAHHFRDESPSESVFPDKQ